MTHIPKDWKDKHRGRRCFILASGISVLSVDLSKLEKELVIGVNRSYKGRVANYHCISDPAAMRYWSAEIKEIAKHTNMVFNSPPCTVLTPGAYTVPMRHTQIQHGGLKVIDLDMGYTLWGRSVVLDLALPLAAYVGCRRVYLLGCDHHGTGHFYDPNPTAGLKYMFGDGVFANYTVFRDHFRKIGGEIYIATPNSKLGMFKSVKYDELFPK